MLQRAAIIDMKLYPFLADAEEIVLRKYGLPVYKLVELRPELSNITMKRIENAIKSGRVPKPASSLEDEVLSFYLSSVLASLIGDRWLISRMALAEAERAYSFMVNEPDENIVAIARHIGLRTLVYRKAIYKEPVAIVRGVIVYNLFNYAMKLVEYIKVAKRLLGDPAWKPINMPVLRGYIYLRREQVLRIMKESLAIYIENKIRSMRSTNDFDRIEATVKPLAEKVRQLLASARRPRVTREGRTIIPRGVIIEEAFPPCISDLVEKARRGENLSHHERFALATFMLNIGADIDSVVDLFRNMPDFNEKITRYQVEHLAGLRGSGKKYLVYSCEKMRTLGICKADCKTRNPVQAYFRNIKSIMGEKRKTQRQKTRI